MRCEHCQKDGSVGKELIMVRDGNVPGLVGMQRWRALCPECREKFRPTITIDGKESEETEHPF